MKLLITWRHCFNSKWLAIISASLFYFYTILLVIIFNPLSEDIIAKYQISSTQFGELSSYYFIGNALALIPAGILYNKLNSKWILVTSSILCFSALLISNIDPTYFMACISRCVIGASNSFAFVGTLRFISFMREKKDRIIFSSVLVIFGSCSGLVGLIPIVLLRQHYTLDFILYLLCALGFIISILLIMFFNPTTDSSFKKSISYTKIFLSKQNFLNNIFVMFAAAPGIILANLWGYIYLKYCKSLNAHQASYVFTSFTLGAVFGSVLFGYLLSLNFRRKPILIASVIIGLICSIGIYYCHSDIIIFYITLFFVLGITGNIQVINFNILQDTHNADEMGMTLSYLSLVNNLGAALIQIFFGYVVEFYSCNKSITPLYEEPSLEKAYLIIPIIFCINLFILFFLKDKKVSKVK